MHPLPPSIPALEAALAVPWATVADQVHLMVSRRPPGKRHAGLSEWPGGRIEAGESPLQAALRELREETGLMGEAARCALLLCHLGHGPRPIRFHVHLVELPGAPAPRAIECVDPRWLPAHQALGLRFPPDNAEINRRIAAWLAESRPATRAPRPSPAR